MRKRDPYKARETRDQINQVTGAREVTVLDRVQEEFELCTRYIEGRMLLVSNPEVARLAKRLEEWLRKMQPHTDGPK